MRKIALLGGLAVVAAAAGAAVIASAGAPGPGVSASRSVPVLVAGSKSPDKPVTVDDPARRQVPVSDADLIRSPKIHDAGQSYGSLLGVPPGEGPDLVEVYADGARTRGYVYRQELEAHDTQTLQEAKDWMDHHDPIILKVYRNDGQTVIGQFTADPGIPAPGR